MCNMAQAHCATSGRIGRKMKAQRVFCVALLGGTVAVCLLRGATSPPVTNVFHATTPAGYDVLQISPGGSVLTFLGLIECPDLEGAQQIEENGKSRIVNAEGKPLAYFPRTFSFRITASLRKTVLINPVTGFNPAEDPEDLLLKLRFRMKIYHDLDARIVEPESVHMIGVPADIPYDERVYRITFTVPNLPVTDRCVLEVLSPEGERLTKFHFDLL
jgi:hypothetical protein